MKKISDLEKNWQPEAEEIMEPPRSGPEELPAGTAAVVKPPHRLLSKGMAGWGVALGVSLLSAPALLNYYGTGVDGGYGPVPEIIKDATASSPASAAAGGGGKTALPTTRTSKKGSTLPGSGWGGDYVDPDILNTVEKTADEIIVAKAEAMPGSKKEVIAATVPETTVSAVVSEPAAVKRLVAVPWTPGKKGTGVVNDGAADSDGWRQVASLGPEISQRRSVLDVPVSTHDHPVAAKPTGGQSATAVPAVTTVSKPSLEKKPDWKPATAKPSPAGLKKALEPLLLKKGEERPLKLDFAYSIQVGAFLEREGVFRRAAQLRRQGYNAYVLELWGIKDPSRLWQSVRIGRFNDPHAAYAAANAFKIKEGIGAYAAESDSFAGVKLSKPVNEPFAGWQAVAEVDKVKVQTTRVAKTDTRQPVAVEPSSSIPVTAKKRPDAAQPAPVGADVSRAPEKMRVRPVSARAAALQPVPGKVEESRTAPAKEAMAPTVPTTEPVSPAGRPEPIISKRTIVVTTAEKPAVAVSEKPMTGQTAETSRKPAVFQPAPTLRSGKTVTGNTSPWLLAKATPAATGTRKDFFEGPVRSARTKNSGRPPVTASAKTPPPTAAPVPAVEAKSAVPTGKPVVTAPGGGEDAQTLFRQAEEARGIGDSQREETMLLATIRQDPHHALARRRLARLFVESDRADKALMILQEAVAGRTVAGLVDEDPNLAAFLAALYQRQEEHWRAIDYYENLLNHYPRKGIWRMGMAISLEKVNEPTDALKAYQLALSSGGLNRKLQSFVQKRIKRLQ